MSEVIKMSKSKISCYMSCPRQYEFRYCNELRPIKKNLNLAIGGVTHKASEMYLNSSSETVDKLNEIAWEEYKPDDLDCESEGDLIKSKAMSRDLVKLFIKEANVSPMPQMVEHKFEMPLANLATGEEAENIIWNGIIDLVDQRKNDSYIVDIKTSSRIKSRFDIHSSFELTGYAFAYRMEMGKKEDGVSLINLIKTKTPKLQILNDVRNYSDFNEFFNSVTTIVSNILDGRFYKNVGLHCSYCDYRSICAGDFDTILQKFGEDQLRHKISDFLYFL